MLFMSYSVRRVWKGVEDHPFPPSLRLSIHNDIIFMGLSRVTVTPTYKQHTDNLTVEMLNDVLLTFFQNIFPH